MPTLIAKKYMIAKAARFFHEKKKRAAMAPTWNAPMAMVVIQLMRPCWYSRPMRRSCLTFILISATAGMAVGMEVWAVSTWVELISSVVMREVLIFVLAVLELLI